jgi:cell wall-associated NlpC family hydrolase
VTRARVIAEARKFLGLPYLWAGTSGSGYDYLVFFRSGATGPISHTGIYIGGGNIINAPRTGAVIRIDSLSSFASYAGARRYLSR